MSTGLGFMKGMPGLTLTSKRELSTTNDATAQVDLGTEIRLNDGRILKYFQANEAVTIGDCLVILLPDVTQTNLTAATATTSTTVTDTGTFTAARYDGAREEYYYATNGGTGPGQVRRIISNTADALTIDNAPDTALDTTTDGVTFSPFRWEMSDAATEQVCGVSLGTVSAGNFGWAQKKGFCPLVQFAGDTNAAAAYQGLVPTATDGVASGRTAAGITVAQLEVMFGYAYYAYTAASVDSRGIAAMLHCK